MSTKPLTQPRTSQACQRCRALKARCLPSTEQGICQRCLTSKRDCVWPEVQQRNKLPRGPSRISQVEKKIDGLVARIANTRTSDRPNTPEDSLHSVGTGSTSNKQDYQTLTSRSSESPDSIEQQEDEQGRSAYSIQDVTQIHAFGSDSDDEMPESQLDVDNTETGHDDSLTKKLINHPDMELLFERYRAMAPSFPFIPISWDTSAEGLCKRKPILVLAIMAVASWPDPKTQMSLDNQYRREIASRTFIRPRKSIALLQSLLVYSAWFHLFREAKFENGVMLQTCLGLTSELRINPQTLPQTLPGRDVLKRIRYGKDGQRALLGCFYLCSVIASSLRTTNLFRYSDYMCHCAKQLGQEAESESDKIIPHLISARQLDDQIYNYMHPSEFQAVLPSKDQVLGQLRVWESLLNEWNHTVPNVDDPHLLTLSYHGIRMELYHSVFRHLCRSDAESYSPTFETAKTNILNSCLEEGRSLLDALISVPVELFTHLSFPVWIRLPRTIVTLAMITTPSDHHAPQWNVKIARDRLRLDLFIETLCFRMQSMTTFNPPAQTVPDFWALMKIVLQSVSKWYKRIMNRRPKILTPASSTTRNDADTGMENLTQADFDLHFPSTNPSHLQTIGHNAYTPVSIDGNDFNVTDQSAYFQPIHTTMCPMMRLNTDPGMDQFMETSFWGDGFGGIDHMNFDYAM